MLILSGTEEVHLALLSCQCC